MSVDVDNLSRKSAMDASFLRIKDLVRSTIVNGKVLPEVTFFQLSSKSKVMMTALSKLSNSVLLQQFWKENGVEALKRTAQREGDKLLLGVDDVEELVWTPSEQKLQYLQERFSSGDISFEEIDKYFKVFKGNQDLANEIKLITSKHARATESLINQRIEQIDQYYRLHNCIDAAKSILEFKTLLNLGGDFRLVEVLYNQVCQSFKRFYPCNAVRSLSTVW